MSTTANDNLIAPALQPSAQPAWLGALCLLAFAAAVALTAFRTVRQLHDPVKSSAEPLGLIDFHHVVYLPAVAFRDGVNPYSAEYAQRYPVNRQYPPYSPGMFVLNLPFAYLPLGAANVVYFTASVAMVLALAASALAVCRLPVSATNVIGLATLLVVSRPGHINLFLGQFTLPIVLGAVWALALARSRPWLAGIGLAIVTLKPTFGVPLVWLMFCRRDYRATFAGVALGGVLVVAGLAPLVAKDGIHSLLNSIRESESLHVADPIVDPQTTWTRLDAQSLVGKLLPSQSPPWLELAITTGCLLVAGAAVWRLSYDGRGLGADSLSALVIATATLACIYHSTYDGLLLVVPWVGSLAGQLRNQLPALQRPLVACLLTIPPVNYLAAQSITERLGITGPLWTALTAVNSVCIVAVLILAISAAAGPRQDEAI